MTRSEDGLRLNRYLARAGFGSRRSSEDLVRQGRVSINGTVITDLGRRVDPATDSITVDGQPARLPDDFRIYVFHKPHGVVSTLKAQGGQASLLPYRIQADIPDRFMPVGRLDSDSTGLLLWTDDGDLNQKICRPGSGIWKAYQVELNEPLTALVIPELTGGTIRIDGRVCLPCRLDYDPRTRERKLVMHLQEGRRRQIRRMFQAVGFKVLRLHRTDFGPVKLGRLHPGDFRRLSGPEEMELRKLARAKS